MGELIAVTEKPSSNPGVVRFETNRALTGMGHERYRRDDEVWGERPPDVLARRLFAHGTVDAVHINANMVTVDLSKGRSSEGLKEIIENLYWYYDEERTAKYLEAEAAKAKAAEEAAAAEAAAKAAEETKAAEEARAAEAQAAEAAEEGEGSEAGEAVVEETPVAADSSVPEEPAEA